MSNARFLKVDADFSREALNNLPNRAPLNCGKLDDELNKIEITLNKVIVNQMMLMRDDALCKYDEASAKTYFHSVVLQELFAYMSGKLDDVVNNKKRIELLEKCCEESKSTNLQLKSEVEALKRNRITPKTITATTDNIFHNNEIAHKIDRAALDVMGIVQLSKDLNSNSDTQAATIGALKRLSDSIKSWVANQLSEIKSNVNEAVDNISSASSFSRRKEYTKAGNHTFVVPAGVKQLRLTMVGGGQISYNYTTGHDSNKHGGSTQYHSFARNGLLVYQKIIDVEPNESIPVKVGDRQPEGARAKFPGTRQSSIDAKNAPIIEMGVTRVKDIEAHGGLYKPRVVNILEQYPPHDYEIKNTLYPQYGRTARDFNAVTTGYVLIEY